MAAAGGSWKGGRFSPPSDMTRALVGDTLRRWQGKPIHSLSVERQRVHGSLRQGEMRLAMPKAYGLSGGTLEATQRSVDQTRAVLHTLDRLLGRA